MKNTFDDLRELLFKKWINENYPNQTPTKEIRKKFIEVLNEQPVYYDVSELRKESVLK